MATRRQQTGRFERIAIVAEVIVLAAGIAAVIKGDTGPGIYIAAIALAGVAIALLRLRRLRREASRPLTFK